MSLIPRLVMSNLRVHKIRAALTIAAIALAVSLVVAVTSGYASARAAAQKVLSIYLGTTDATITRDNDHGGGIEESLVDAIGQDPAVEQVNGRLELEAHLLKSNGEPIMARAVQVIGVKRPEDKGVETLRLEAGSWFRHSEGNDAVIDQVAQERLEVKVGDEFLLPAGDKRMTLRVSGVVHKPGLLAMQVQTIYVPLRTLQQFMLPSDQQRRLSRVLVDLKTGADHDAFLARWKPKLAGIDPNLRIKLSSENRKEMDRNLQGLQMVSYLGGAVSMVAATFIVFSALSMGVAERQRTLAMLRAIGAQRIQLGWLVVCEGLMLALAGVLIGVPLGYLWIEILAWQFSEVFTAGAAWSVDGTIAAVVGSTLAALAASLLPALIAMRASPLDAMSPLAKPPTGRGVILSTIVGLILITLDPLILFSPLNRSVQFYAHFTIGVGALLLGFFLLAPATVWLVERVAGPIVAAMFGLDFAMLRQQLSGGIWRAAGTCAALMVGLAILVVTQTQGISAVHAWRIPDRFPDIFIMSGIPLSQQDQQKLAHIPGIRSDQIMPIAVASPQFGSNFLAIVGASIIPDATFYFGIDPDLALKMLDLDFREGSPEEATRMLKLGRHIIVTQEYKQLKGLGVGSTLPLKTSKGVVDFTVAGVVWSPGIDVLVGMYDLDKQFEQRTVSCLFGTLDDAREYFGVQRNWLFAANLDPHVEKATLMARIKQDVARMGLDAGDVRQIKYGIQKALSRVVLLVSTVAYAALAVASLGVTNTIMASIRSRRWQFGILRSIGVTRGQLVRLVLAEAVLLGIVGVGLGLLAGSELIVNARQEWKVFVGFIPPMVVPWTRVAIGIAVVMLVSILASLWPAASVARSEPLSLLQAGRAAA